jgi:dTDP-4-dehydrorhamnose 3,5-epimerase
MIKLEHTTFFDHRGSYTPIGLNNSEYNWTQCSISVNEKPFTFRGLHYQSMFSQTKYIKVIQGSIIDFIVDLETKEVEHFKLDNQNAILIPNTKAHGFLTLEPNTIICYLVDNQYAPNYEHSIVWNTIPEVESVIKSYTGNNHIVISQKDSTGK